MADKGYLLSGTAVKRTAAVVKREEGRLPRLERVDRRTSMVQQPYKCKLTSALASGSFTAPQTCTVDVWMPDPDSLDTPPPLIVSTEDVLLELTVTSYWLLAESAAIGTQAMIAWGDAGWEIVWLDCDVPA